MEGGRVEEFNLTTCDKLFNLGKKLLIQLLKEAAGDIKCQMGLGIGF
jgi:hypothetical protein